MGRTANLTKTVLVANAYEQIDSESVSGTCYLKSNTDEFWFNYLNSKGDINGTDIIKKQQINRVKAVPAESMRKGVVEFTIILDNNVNSGNVITGEDYIVDVSISKYYTVSNQDEYIKYGCVHGAGQSVSSFYATLAKSIVANFTREPDCPIKVFVTKSDTSVVEVKANSDLSNLTLTNVKIQENKPFYRRNDFSFERYILNVTGKTVSLNNVEVNPFVITKSISTTVYLTNGYETADLEDWALSAKGWKHYGVTLPLDSVSMVDPEKEYNYLHINYYHIGDGTDADRTNKELVIVSEDVSVINSIVTAINTATGASYETIDVEEEEEGGGDTPGGDTPGGDTPGGGEQGEGGQGEVTP